MHQQLWLLLFPWFPQFRKGQWKLPYQPRSVSQKGLETFLAFKNGIKQNMACCRRFEQRLRSVSVWIPWPDEEEGSVVANSPELCSGLNLSPRVPVEAGQSCPFACCCPGLAGRRGAGSLVLPHSPAWAGQCSRNQPCPRCCWGNSAFAFKERSLYQNNFSENAKRFYVFPLLLSSSYFQAVKW